MKYYITEQEFREKLLNAELPSEEVIFFYDFDGVSNILFNVVYYKDSRVFLYNYPETLDVAILQEDEDGGWEKSIHDVWEDISSLGYKLYVE